MYQQRCGWVRMFLLLVLPFGCAGCPDTSLPATLGIPLPNANGLSLDAPSGSGVESVANSSWSVYQNGQIQYSKQAALQPLPLLLRMEFGPAGEITRIFDNQVFAPETIGQELISDRQLHAAPFPGSSYVAAGYAGELGSSVGFAGFGKFFAGPLTLAETTIFVVGILNSEKDRFEGTLTLDIRLTKEGEALLQDAPIDTNRQSRPIVAIRE